MKLLHYTGTCRGSRQRKKQPLGPPKTQAACRSALQPWTNLTMELPSLLLHWEKGDKKPWGSWEGAAGALSGDAPSKLGLCSNAPPRPPWPPSCPQLLPPLTSPCASFTVFMNTAIPIAAVLIVSGPSLPHWAGEGQVESHPGPIL